MKHIHLTSNFCLYLIWLILEGPMKFRSSTATHNKHSSRDKQIRKRHKEKRGLLSISTAGSTFLGDCCWSLWLTSFNCILATIHVCPMISDDATQADISFFFFYGGGYSINSVGTTDYQDVLLPLEEFGADLRHDLYMWWTGAAWCIWGPKAKIDHLI